MKQTNNRNRKITIFAVAVAFFSAVYFWLPQNETATEDSMLDESRAHYAGPFKVYVELDPVQAAIGDNTLKITLRDKDNQAVVDAQINAAAEMPAMGSMQAMSAPATMKHDGTGAYTGVFELPMNGAWPLSLEISSNSTGNARLEFDLTTSRAGVRLSSATASNMSRPASSITDTPETRVARADEDPGSISMDARRRQLIGVTTGLAEEKVLAQTIRAAGRVAYNETRYTDITLKFNGWIGKLDADFVGASVVAGEPLFTVYSPELLSAQQEYLGTLRHRKGKNDTLLKAARKRLALWDITQQQIHQLGKRGSVADYVPILSPVSGTVIEKIIVKGSAVKAGQRLMRIADLSTVWVEGEIYEYEIPLVKVGMDVEVVLPELPGKNLPGKVAYIYPYMEARTRTAKIRVELDNQQGLLKPGMYAHVHLNIDLGKRLVVPEGAVLYAGTSRVVFIDLGNGQLQPRKIKTGWRNADVIEVLEGLKPGDRVVTSGNFLIAAESKLKAGLDQW
ncbi:MAG: hypothetical protein BMS9Abin26_2170 [Gammaproteobacteria bacterium]|nr:MAG: hypothetical protein BMS9Abin26_2170 [Gammaproteobacteria bacterium]